MQICIKEDGMAKPLTNQIIIFDKYLDEIYNDIKSIPLYKQKSKEEYFLGILKSKSRSWIGWKFLKEIKKYKMFYNEEMFLNLYELALNYHYMCKLRGDYNLKEIKKKYDF